MPPMSVPDRDAEMSTAGAGSVRVDIAVPRPGARGHPGFRCGGDGRGGRREHRAPPRWPAARDRTGRGADQAADPAARCWSASTTRSVCWSAAAVTCPTGSRPCAAPSRGVTTCSVMGRRRLFAVLAVFRGGAGLDDVEAVCAGRHRARHAGRWTQCRNCSTRACCAGRRGRRQPRYTMLGDRPRVRRRKAGRPARGRRRSISAHAHRFAALCRAPRAAAGLAGQRLPRPARPRPRQPTRRIWTGCRIASREQALRMAAKLDCVLVDPRSLRRGAATPARPARPVRRREPGARGRSEWSRLAGARSG